ncbi:hypothetical protein NQ314_006908 [Rhamnusium bicolor]|uniref:Uncharacterized protein n=1 Tax=Rhamnusium bicolor TaxID=1586634 RepID=A0AAV8YX77_9CUCU|nr:hypothetical protein NQ314_006908 [Rhamnusium bicolor]
MRFIFTYDSEAIYFFDPKTSSLMFWNNSFENIKGIKILNSFIYIWHDDLKINTISLTLLDDIIVKTLLNKQYFLCAQLCANYAKDVINLVEDSRDIHLISALKTKLIELQATELLEKNKPNFTCSGRI